ncbi:hypothetical protein Y032_0026g1394 [Ancylostoma ceylanicum]|uniref:Reverse transcriptase domain-containing protein n=1 Tax=Ancylostoma ceylanicum TaxID=53326 RepID=A0A016UVL2_9BILA|nr:hypothetical protein Y032_0026g1394 [Ancylostoma ceylanicum]
MDLAADVLTIEIVNPSNASLLQFTVVYRPPNSSKADDEKLIDQLSYSASSCTRSVVLGDFNLHIDWDRRAPLNHSSASFFDFFSDCGLHQNVTSPTHNNNVLDLVLSSSAIISSVTMLPPLGSSDHNIVCFEIVDNLSNVGLLLPDFRSANYSSIDAYLSSIDWLSLFDHHTSCTDVYYRFCNAVYIALSKFVPFTVPDNNGPKIPAHIEALILQKQRLFQNSSNPLRNTLYKKVCSDIDHHMRKYLANYERRLAANTSYKKLYAYVSHKIKPSSHLPALEDALGNVFVRDADKANALTSHFSSVFSCVTSFRAPMISDKFQIPHSLCTVFFHPSDVLKILQRLRPSHTETYDGIPQIVFQKCASSLSIPLAHIFNISMLLGEVPDVWKKAIVKAIPKVHGAKLLNDFRPISLLPTPIKVMEKIVREKLLSWLNRFRLIPAEQHGFLSGASTATNLADSIFDWSLAINQGKAVDVIYVDLSKAFDKVCHAKLLRKLEAVGIRGSLLSWLTSYLHKRQMTVKVESHYSDEFCCTCGVPQGGVLSPLLFLIYTIDLPDILKTSPHVKIQMYADDIKVYGIYTPENCTEVRSALQASLANLEEWASTWDLTINLNKSSVLHLGFGETINYVVDGASLKSCRSIKDLGVLVDDRLNMRLPLKVAVVSLLLSSCCIEAKSIPRKAPAKHHAAPDSDNISNEARYENKRRSDYGDHHADVYMDKIQNKVRRLSGRSAMKKSRSLENYELTDDSASTSDTNKFINQLNRPTRAALTNSRTLDHIQAMVDQVRYKIDDARAGNKGSNSNGKLRRRTQKNDLTFNVFVVIDYSKQKEQAKDLLNSLLQNRPGNDENGRFGHGSKDVDDLSGIPMCSGAHRVFLHKKEKEGCVGSVDFANDVCADYFHCTLNHGRHSTKCRPKICEKFEAIPKKRCFKDLFICD